MSWLKFETNTPEKPEVLSITMALGWDDPDLTVGKLLKVWRWFDQHTTDGNASGVTTALLDRIIGVTGLSDAMASVGWLVVENGKVSLPNFGRHNGQTAKDRALTAKRVGKHKSNANGNDEGNAQTVTSALPREEKRREENKQQEQDQKPSSPRGDTPSRFAEFWAEYPKGEGKKKAREVWQRRKLDALADRIIADVRDRKTKHGQWLDGFIPLATTYLNGDRWDDPIVPRQARAGPNAAPTVSKTTQFMQEQARRIHDDMAALGNTDGAGWAALPQLGEYTAERGGRVRPDDRNMGIGFDAGKGVGT